MADTLEIPVSDLLFDEENPRLSLPNIGQREAQRELARDQQTKLLKLAEDIVKYGLNPADLPIVIPFDIMSGRQRYAVLEGNRRLVAIKSLENPDSMVRAFTPIVLKAIKKLSADYQQNPIESINCLIVKDKEEADHWRDLRHSGEMEGAGIVRWGADERARFFARAGTFELHTQVLNFLEDRGYLTPQNRKDIPTASFKRLIATPEVRAKLGIDIKDKKLQLLGDEKRVAKALMYVIGDLVSGKTVTKNIYLKDDRIRYADELPADIVVTPTAKGGRAVAVKPGARPAPKPPANVPTLRQRDKLIPRDCALNITDRRLRLIEAELRSLNIDTYTNAVAVLFRVFVELSVDTYLTRHSLPVAERTPLTKKIQDTADHLVNRRKLNKEQARPVRRAAQADSFLAPSTTLLNAFVHNQYIFPAPSDLRAHWDSLQPFFIAIWSV